MIRNKQQTLAWCAGAALSLGGVGVTGCESLPGEKREQGAVAGGVGGAAAGAAIGNAVSDSTTGAVIGGALGAAAGGAGGYYGGKALEDDEDDVSVEADDELNERDNVDFDDDPFDDDGASD